MENKNVEKKNIRISNQQKEKMVEFMSNHLAFARGQFGGINSNINSKAQWEELSTLLNSLGGSAKSVEQWKKCWADLKAGVRKHVNSRRAFMNKTGGGTWSEIPRDLNYFEEEILKIITVDGVDGDSRTPESGFEIDENFEESTLAIEILEDDDSCTPSKKFKCSKSPASASSGLKFKEALSEAKSMTEQVMVKLNKIEKQNEMILQKLCALEEEYMLK